MGRHPTVLITGGDGQVGRAMKARLPDALALGRRELDVTNARAMADAAEKADVVVHLAAWTDVDGCESDPELARSVNVDGTRAVVSAAGTTGARLIYLSTDYVFDGRSERPYREDDAPNPISVYGLTKREGEEIVAGHPGALIMRASWVFGDGRNFVETILDAARGGKPLRVVDDQRGIPTPAAALADAITFSIERELEGIIHVAGDGPIVSWAEFAETALETAGVRAEVEPVSTAEYVGTAARQVAPRPKFSALDISKARSLGVPLLDWRAGLEKYIGAMR